MEEGASAAYMHHVDLGAVIGVLSHFFFEGRPCSVEASNVLVLTCTVMSRVMGFTSFLLGIRIIFVRWLARFLHVALFSFLAVIL